MMFHDNKDSGKEIEKLKSLVITIISVTWSESHGWTKCLTAANEIIL